LFSSPDPKFLTLNFENLIFYQIQIQKSFLRMIFH